MSDDMNFADYIEQERERIATGRRLIAESIAGWQSRLDELDREQAAIDAYEAAKTGKPQRAIRGSVKGQRASRGGRREAILQAVQNAPDGIRRGELLEAFGLKGDKAGEMSISNALTALTKAGQLVREGGKYHAPATPLQAAAE